MQKVILAITDGIGINADSYANAFAAAAKPNYQRLEREALKCKLATSGLAVGLPAGQMGNSEVGHMCLGSGRVILQSLVKIDQAIQNGDLAQQKAMAALLERAKNGARVHVFGLYSPGGVHSHARHFDACVRLLQSAISPQAATPKSPHAAAAPAAAPHAAAAPAAPAADATTPAARRLFVHAFGDGRDVLPKSLSDYLASHECAQPFDSIAGRFWAMDRDNNLERTNAYINMLRSRCATGELFSAINAAKSDEFIKPTMLANDCDIRAGDEALIINFRADRARQLASALANEGLKVTCMCEYDAALNLDVIFAPEHIDECLAQIISERGFSQLHVAETEKYAHVSFFFNGGKEEPFANESRVLVPSSGAANYAQTPKMSASAITDAVLAGVQNGVDFVVLNYANGDMVGHTGDYEAAIIAVEEVDTQLGRLMDAAQKANYALLITSDHGNCEQMRDKATQKVLSNHTTFDVGCWLFNYHAAGANGDAGGAASGGAVGAGAVGGAAVGGGAGGAVGAAASGEICLQDGTLANIAATVLEIMNIPASKNMQPSLIAHSK